MLIRHAKPEDQETVIALWEETSLTRPWNDPVQDFDRALTCSTSTIFVQEDENKTAQGTIMAGYDGHRGWLYYLAISPNAQRSGLGSQLVAHAERWLKEEQNAHKVQLMIRSENKDVQTFYKSNNYEHADISFMQKWLK